MKRKAMVIIGVILGVIILYAAGWAVTSFLIWLLSLLFHFEFSFALSTGIFIILLIAKWVFSSGKGKG